MEKNQIVNVLLTGANGMLAAEVKRLKPVGISLIETDVAELDITNAAAVDSFLAAHAPDAVLNCAAYTAVDQAESDRAAAFAVNEAGPANLARACAARRIPLVHVSTDFVFGGAGNRPLAENDTPAPRGVYAESKRAGETAIERAGCTWLIVRASWLYGLHGRNFPDTILRLAAERDQLTVVHDQKGAPTYAPDLAAALWLLMARKAEGYVHFSDSGACTWFEFACETVRQARATGLLPAQRQVEIRPVTTAEFPRPAPRPAYSVLSTQKYAAIAGQAPRPWQDALHDYLAARAAPRV